MSPRASATGKQVVGPRRRIGDNESGLLDLLVGHGEAPLVLTQVFVP